MTFLLSADCEQTQELIRDQLLSSQLTTMLFIVNIGPFRGSFVGFVILGKQITLLLLQVFVNRSFSLNHCGALVFLLPLVSAILSCRSFEESMLRYKDRLGRQARPEF